MVCRHCIELLQGFPSLVSLRSPSNHTHQSLDPQSAKDTLAPPPNPLLTSAFSPLSRSGWEALQDVLSSNSSQNVLVPLSNFSSGVRYSSSSPCLFYGATNAVRGGLWGMGLGSVYGLGNSISIHGLNFHTLQDAARVGLRMGGGFAAYTGVYSSTRCALVKARRQHDVINTLAAGAFTGALLSFIQVRGQWRLYQNHIVSCTMMATGFAFVFDMLQRV